MAKIFKHFKGQSYKFIGVATHSETEEKLVIYSNLKGEMYARPYQMFFDNVVVNGQQIPRFMEIDDDDIS